jgi:hypothetical protein
METMSHSRGRTLGECGHKYFLKYRENVPEQPSWALIGGKAWHNWAQDYELSKLRGDQRGLWPHYLDAAVESEVFASGLEPKEFRAAGRKSKAHPDGETFSVWLNELGPDMIAKYEAFDWGVWKIATDLPRIGEMSAGSAIGIEYPLKLANPAWQGYVDQIRRDRTGNYIAIDLKTGQRIYKTTQLEEYGGGGRLNGIRISYGGYYLSRKAEFTWQPLRWSNELFVQYVTDRHTLSSSGIFTPNVGDHCGWCPVRDHCQYG